MTTVEAAIQSIAPFDINKYVADGKKTQKITTTDKAAITIAPGTVITPPENFIDWIMNNWKLSAIALVAVVILIKD